MKMTEFRALIREEITKVLAEKKSWFQQDKQAMKLQAEIQQKLDRLARKNGTDDAYSGNTDEQTGPGADIFAATLAELKVLFPTEADRKKIEVIDFRGDSADDNEGYDFAVVPSAEWDKESIGWPFKRRLSAPKYSKKIDSYKGKSAGALKPIKTGFSKH